MDHFTAFRYFEEFEKRIPRAEMEQMEVIKHLDLFVIIKLVLFQVFLHCVLMSSFRLLLLESWRRSIQIILEQSVEVTGEVKLHLITINFQFMIAVQTLVIIILFHMFIISRCSIQW